MSIVSQEGLARLCGIDGRTFYGMVRRGTLPRGDIQIGTKYHFYSQALALRVQKWCSQEYKPYKRGQKFSG